MFKRLLIATLLPVVRPVVDAAVAALIEEGRKRLQAELDERIQAQPKPVELPPVAPVAPVA